MKTGQIGVTLDDLPGVWIITQAWDELLISDINNPTQWKMTSRENFWVIL